MEHVEVLRDLSEVCRAAIKAGDWKVDGACDPDAALRRADAAIASLSAPQPPAEAQPDHCANHKRHVWGCRSCEEAAGKFNEPAEAQPVAWEWEYIGVDQHPRGHKVARSLREMDPTNPPYPETWRPTRPLIYGDTAPPSAPVGVEGFRTAVEKARRVWMDENPCEDGHDHVTPFDQFLYGALAQQPAASKPRATRADPHFTNTGNSEDEFVSDDAIACTACGGSGHRDDQQPAAVDSEMVKRAVNAYDEATGEGWQMPCLHGMRAALTAALAAQQGGSDNDR